MELERFAKAHEEWYAWALKEVQGGKKRSHWMWFIFPQIKGLGRSETAQYFAIQSREEAHAYLAHPVLRAHLEEICGALLALPNTSARAVFGYTDSVKLHSSMTLFCAVGDVAVCRDVLERFFGGKMDQNTLEILSRM